jgi:hypothetical protein
MEYDDFDVLVSDLNENKIKEIGIGREIQHLSDGKLISPAFPVKGHIYGLNIRFSVLQDHNKPDSKILNVWFLVDTGSPLTCLTVKNLEAFFGAGNVVG